MTQRADARSPAALALESLQKAKKRIIELETQRSEPIAIVGMACRFPGNANTPDEYFHLLNEGHDCVCEMPSSRRLAISQTSIKAGWLEKIDEFDADLFGITADEANYLDPQQRLLLHVAWEAFEDGGFAIDRLFGSKTGVFIGISTQDYLYELLRTPNVANQAAVVTGNGHCFAAGRLSYVFGFEGPSLAVDTACSSSLSAVHLACQSLRLRESDLAVAAGVNLLVSDQTTQMIDATKALAADGRCKAFDEQADGFVRGEGCGVVLLKRLSDARRDGDRILALIRGSAMNQDGRSMGITAPNVLAQTQLIRTALNNARVSPAEVSYVETHGTGTAIGDPIEVDALRNVFDQDVSSKVPCILGAVKTNVGHLEAAAGIAGLIKTVLALQHEVIPKNLHFHRLNPLIDLDHSRFAIPTESIPWTKGETPRIAGVSSFGMSGTNVHLVLEEAPERVNSPQVERIRPCHLLTLSGHSKTTLLKKAAELAEFLKESPAVHIKDVAHTTNTGRVHLSYRSAVVGSSHKEIIPLLESMAKGDDRADELMSQVHQQDHRPKVAFLYSGQGSQFPAMGKELYQTHPVFKKMVDRCAKILDPLLGSSIVSLLLSEELGSQIHEIGNAAPAQFVLQVALTELWKSWGITPDVVAGHSVGEYAAAWAAGVFSLEDALRLVAARCSLMQGLPKEGAMVSIAASREQVAEVMKPYSDQVSIAVVNTYDQIVISGKNEAVLQIVEQFEKEGIQTKKLEISHASHSPLMSPILEDFRKVAESVTYHTPAVPYVSNMTGDLESDLIMNVDYWVEHLIRPVVFVEGMNKLKQLEVECFVEIGPHRTLLSFARDVHVDAIGIPSMERDQPVWPTIANALAQLYRMGAHIDWTEFDQPYGCQKIRIPTYPFESRKYWASELSYPTARNISQTKPEAVASLDLPVSQDTSEIVASDDSTTSQEEQKIFLSPVESSIARHFTELLGRKFIDPQTNFFAIGGDSLLATRLTSRLRDEFKVHLELGSVLKAQTVQKIAKKIKQLQEDGKNSDNMSLGPIKRVNRNRAKNHQTSNHDRSSKI
ncbi:type I polyketide synthase [Thermoflavimicrobium daqui]|uniref:Uncharacterized protein n=1 Tax=Thermoflavimicrobium daqui TaxID=2137476 RepID=A0A364K3A0_9BACL|nr:type I polyketide synthase [Thermoflavimicrobium daqui]RAL23310.1 hypothetical protein DL897_11475 [Thermoflavimicrobium daqui]